MKHIKMSKDYMLKYKIRNEIDNDYINDKVPFIKQQLFKAGSTLAEMFK